MESQVKTFAHQNFDQLNLQLIFENLYISLLGSYTIHEPPDKHVLGGDPYGLNPHGSEGLVLSKIPQREYCRMGVGVGGRPLKGCESLYHQGSFY